MKLLKIIYVEFMPNIEDMEEGTIYISSRYSISGHKCLCGCGNEVVMPFNKTNGWKLTQKTNGQVTFYPSVGNWNFSCRSHYWIKNSSLEWNGDGPPVANLNLPFLEKVRRLWKKIKGAFT